MIPLACREVQIKLEDLKETKLWHFLMRFNFFY